MSNRSRPSTSTSARAHLLLVCPPLFSYHLAIKAELEARGFDVTWWNDRAGDGSLHKLSLRLWPALFVRCSTPLFRRRLHALGDDTVSNVLVVKGEGLSPEFMMELKERIPGARRSLYLWDSAANTRGAAILAPHFDTVATFDPVDAKTYGWKHRPLFASAVAAPPPSRTEHSRFDWCFVGTVHSDRCRVIERLRRSAPKRRSFVFGYIPSQLLLAIRYLVDSSMWRIPTQSISTSAMSAADVAAIARSSRAVLDIEHPRQRGLTMRSIETLLSGKKLITTNRHILDSDLFHPSRVHVISRSEPAVPDTFFEMPFEPIDPAIGARYSLTRWAHDLVATPASECQANSAGPFSSDWRAVT